ncbi:hypothetical protein Acsp06_30720 [Actinomycetospora sp. NBRC 106375]|uniref:alpha/beta hydrolase n=1 Tax=Actinomycetospora sp. NBRC 106375 TaxID=3032207 RepID=UPI0024A5F357|nr:alpha/beta hydrolase-fold protein [Actinomycetospora sp. NBRC 106375]GLZ46887.1 hypothetical protein Acsp06_30720 [Actinomycetospora sp. NBRC 106375]
MPVPRYGHGPSLLDGWLPWTVQALVLLLLLLAVGRRSGRFRRRRLPIVVVLGAAGALGAWLSFRGSGLASDPAPLLLWVWVGLTVAAVALVVVGWPGARWWRRTVSVLVVPLCVLCVGVVLNQWVGYVTTVSEGWGEVTAGPLPDQIEADQLASLRGNPTATGHVVPVSIPATGSGFAHREEYVWLPPAWFTGSTPLPVVMMIAGEFNTPADWMRIGDAEGVADAYAAAHGGVAPILVFVDAGGTFNNDTECVDGPRGAAADHLTRDVVPYVEQHFGASSDPRQWGVVGWSMGGTCAVDLAVMHPELVDSFVDIAGDAGPEVGTRDQTIARLYGGDAAAWARFDPATVLAGHPPYPDTAGRFVDSADGPGSPRRPGRPPGGARGPDATDAADAGVGGRGGGGATGQELPEAQALCAQATPRGIACAVDTQPGRHSWPFASTAFADALPWLAGRLAAPGSPPTA